MELQNVSATTYLVYSKYTLYVKERKERTRLLSRGTAIGLEFYRNQGLPGLENSKGTAVFPKELNDLFDVFNAKLPKEGIRPGSSKQKVKYACCLCTEFVAAYKTNAPAFF
ncbi:hypothetical protein MTO96_050660 [Rhipicephalus appendiculatus]